MASFISLESKLRKSGFSLIAGVDEAGRGPLAGPVVCAAVILKPKARLPKLNDSKKLTKATREKLFDQIIDQSLDYSITIASHKTIDEINILESVKLANFLCIERLNIRPHITLIDGRDKQLLKSPFKTVIKGDQKVRCIAAASILAKVTRDRLMEYYSQKFPNYAFNEHMGYGTRKHRSNIKKHGPCEIHRTSFTLI